MNLDFDVCNRWYRQSNNSFFRKSLTLEPLHHDDSDTILDAVHIANTPPFVAQLVNQTRNMSKKKKITKTTIYYSWTIICKREFCRMFAFDKYLKIIKLNSFHSYLIRVVFSKKYNFYVARFTNECLRKFCFAAKHSSITTIGHICFCISVHNLVISERERKKDSNIIPCW